MITNTITFDQLPEVVMELRNEIVNLREHLLEKKQSAQPASDQWFDIAQLCAYLPDKPCVPTVYTWVGKEKIPFHKGGKKLRFLKSEIDAWLKCGNKTSKSQLHSDVDNFLHAKRRIA